MLNASSAYILFNCDLLVRLSSGRLAVALTNYDDAGVDPFRSRLMHVGGVLFEFSNRSMLLRPLLGGDFLTYTAWLTMLFGLAGFSRWFPPCYYGLCGYMVLCPDSGFVTVRFLFCYSRDLYPPLSDFYWYPFSIGVSRPCGLAILTAICSLPAVVSKISCCYLLFILLKVNGLAPDIAIQF